METLNDRSVNIVGNSDGGWFGLYLSLRRPDLVRKLVIVNSGNVSAGFISQDTSGIERFFPSMFDKSTYLTPPTREKIHEMLLRYTYHKELITIGRVERAFEIAVGSFETHKLRTEATESSIYARNKNISLDEKHISEHAHELKIPVLLAWGRLDEGGASLENGVRLLSRINGAEMHIFDYAKHLQIVDQAERFVSIITDFLKA